RQTTCYPFRFASQYGRGTALALAVACPGYDTPVADNVPWLDIAGVADREGRTLTFFAVNRHGTEPLDLELALAGFGPARLAEHVTIAHPDLTATNTAPAPDTVIPVPGTGATVEDRTLKARLGPYSCHVLRGGAG